MSFVIVRQDITKMEVDAIVNAANTDLLMGGGVCGAIFKAAGAAELQAACDKLAPIQTGEAVITPGFRLPAKFVIHAAGPVYRQWSKEESEALLRAAYSNSLKRAVENQCESIAFPLISSGIYGYPKAEALQVAMSAIQDFLQNHDLEVSLVVFDKSAFHTSRELLGAVESYIDDNYMDEHADVAYGRSHRRLPHVEEVALSQAQEGMESYDAMVFEEQVPPDFVPNLLEDMIDNLDEPFAQMLLRLIDAKEMTDVEVYKRANLDRKLFSKIRSKENYMPSKRTALALAIALELSLEETDQFLARAGFALSHAVKFDVIIEYFIIHGRYDIFEINEVLFEYDQPLLGGCS